MINRSANILAIDQGTTNTKVLLVDAQGVVIAQASRPLTQRYPHPAWVEQDADAIWQKLIDVAPDRAYLAFDRLEALAIRMDSPERFTRLCKRLIDDNPQDWRARLALSRHLAASGRPRDALDLLFAALVQNPHALGIHQAIWRALGQLRHEPMLVDRYSELTRHAVFYLDPHVCLRCRYRSTELLWQCPHCHDWNTFVEERIAPAQDTTEVEV